MLGWVELPPPWGRVSILPRPPGAELLEPAVSALAALGVGTLVSMLPRDEEAWLELEHEAAVCQKLGLRFVSFPVTDHSVPDDAAALATQALSLAGEVRAGRGVAVHCYAGIGRSAVMAASVLRALGLSAEEAFTRLSRARGLLVPDTVEQRAFVEALRFEPP